MVLGYIILQSKLFLSFLDCWSFLGVKCLVIPWFEEICFCLEPSLNMHLRLGTEEYRTWLSSFLLLSSVCRKIGINCWLYSGNWCGGGGQVTDYCISMWRSIKHLLIDGKVHDSDCAYIEGMHTCHVCIWKLEQRFYVECPQKNHLSSEDGKTEKPMKTEWTGKQHPFAKNKVTMVGS